MIQLRLGSEKEKEEKEEMVEEKLEFSIGNISSGILGDSIGSENFIQFYYRQEGFDHRETVLS